VARSAVVGTRTVERVAGAAVHGESTNIFHAKNSMLEQGCRRRTLTHAVSTGRSRIRWRGDAGLWRCAARTASRIHRPRVVT
jgi:hypothetical protein